MYSRLFHHHYLHLFSRRSLSMSLSLFLFLSPTFQGQWTPGLFEGWLLLGYELVRPIKVLKYEKGVFLKEWPLF